MSEAKRDAVPIIEEYGDDLADGYYKSAQHVAEGLTEMDCIVCQHVGATFAGIAVAAEATLNDEVERRLTQMGIARADALAEDFEAARRRAEVDDGAV